METGEILYNYESTEYLFSYENEFRKLVNIMINENKKILGELSYIFCSDEYLLEMNKQYLEHDYYTDVITFNYCEDNLIAGDIFISVDRVGENAKIYNVTFETELKRIMIHGLLHLIGFDDKDTESKKMMTEKEDYYLQY